MATKNRLNCAPLLMPRVLSEANGLPITCCNNRLAKASVPPANNAMQMRGKV